MGRRQTKGPVEHDRLEGGYFNVLQDSFSGRLNRIKIS